MFETRRRVRFTPGGGIPTPPGGSPAGPAAYSYGVPPAQAGGGRGQQPVFPLGQYPVKLPAVSLLGGATTSPAIRVPAARPAPEQAQTSTPSSSLIRQASC